MADMNLLGLNPEPAGIPGNPYNAPQAAPAATPADAGDFPETDTGATQQIPMTGHPQQPGQLLFKGHAPKQQPQRIDTEGIPTLTEYIMRKYTQDGKHNTVSNLTDDDILGLANQFATAHYPSAYAAQGVKLDDKILGSKVDSYENEVQKNMVAIRKALVDEENSRKQATGQTADGVAGALGGFAAGAAQTGAGHAVAGTPGMIANTGGLMPPGALQLLKMAFPEQVKQTQEKVRSGLNVLMQPGAKELKEAGEARLASNPKVREEHPYLTAGAEVLGGIAPYIGLGALTGGAGVAPYAMAEMGGARLEEENARISAMPEPELNALPEYQVFLKATGDPIKAKAMLAKASSEAAEEVGQMMGGIMGTIGGGGMTTAAQRAIAHTVGTGVIKRMLATAGIESAGFTGQQVAGNVLATKATNKATGEQREPDLLAGADQAGIMGAVMGAIGALLKGKGKLAKPTPEATGEATAGAEPEVPPAGAEPPEIPPQAPPGGPPGGPPNVPPGGGGGGGGGGAAGIAIPTIPPLVDNSAIIAKLQKNLKLQQSLAKEPDFAKQANFNIQGIEARIAELEAEQAASQQAVQAATVAQAQAQAQAAQAAAAAKAAAQPPPGSVAVTGGPGPTQAAAITPPNSLKAKAKAQAAGGNVSTADADAAVGAAPMTAAEKFLEAHKGVVTRRMAIDLKRLGFTDEQITKLTPDQAWDHINGNAGPEAAAPGTVDGGVPVMITQAMKAELKKFGYKDEFIAKLTPEAAHHIIADGRKRFAEGGVFEPPGVTEAEPTVKETEPTVPEGVEGPGGGAATGGAEFGQGLGQALRQVVGGGVRAPEAPVMTEVPAITETPAATNPLKAARPKTRADIENKLSTWRKMLKGAKAAYTLQTTRLAGATAAVRKEVQARMDTLKKDIADYERMVMQYEQQLLGAGAGEPLAPGEARRATAEPKKPPVMSDHEIVTAPDMDPRYPLGVLRAALDKARQRYKTEEPTTEQIKHIADEILALHDLSVDADTPDRNRIEALGLLLEDNPHISPAANDIKAKASELADYKNRRDASDIYRERVLQRDQHFKVRAKDVLMKQARQAQKEVDVEEARKELATKRAEEARREMEVKDAAARQGKEENARQVQADYEYKQRQAEYAKHLPKVEAQMEADTKKFMEDELAQVQEEYRVAQDKEAQAKKATEQAADQVATLKQGKNTLKSGAVIKKAVKALKEKQKESTQATEDVAKVKEKLESVKKKAAPKKEGLKNATPPTVKKSPLPGAKTKPPETPPAPKSKKAGAGAAAKTKTAKPKAKFSGGGAEPVRRGFYSRLARTLENADLKFEFLTANAWKRWLTDAENRGQIKKSEREWLGIDQWLDRQGGGIVKGTGKDQPTVIPKISREDVQAFIKAHELKIETRTQKDLPELEDLPNGWYTKYGQVSDTWQVRNEKGEFMAESREGGSEDDAISEALKDLNKDRKPAYGLDNHPDLQLPGGSNYREDFIHIPRQGKRDFSGHNFPDDVNIAAHTRATDRTTTDGKSMLFAEEFQSDWTSAVNEYNTELKSIKEGWTATMLHPPESDGMSSWKVKNKEGTLMHTLIAKSEEQAIDFAAREYYSTNKNPPPDTPFKTGADYFLLGFKHLLREAIESGKDKIGWTTGQQQVDRYALGRKIYDITVTPNKDGGHSLDIRLKTNERIPMTINNKGTLQDGEFVGKKLGSVVGENLAAKIMDVKNDIGVFRGEDLDIGGLFHRNLYDKTGLKAVDEYVKQWGGKVEKSDIGTGARAEERLSKYGKKYWVIVHADGRENARVSEAKAKEDAIQENKNLHAEDKKTVETVHSVDITPEMREAILGKDQPLFAPPEGSLPPKEVRGSGIRESLTGQMTRDAQYLQDNMRSSLAELGYTNAKQARYEQIRVESLSPELRTVVAEWAKAIGHRIVVYRNLTPDIENFKGVNFGNKVLYVNEATRLPATTIAAHEFIHQLRVDHPELYEKLAAEVRRQGRIKDYEKWLEERNYKNVDADLAVEELTANGTADAFTDEVFLKELAKRNPSVFRKIVDAFMKFLNTILGKHGDTGSKDFLSDVDAFRNKLLDVLGEYQPQQASLIRQVFDAYAGRPKFAPAKISTAEEAMEAAKAWSKKPPTLMTTARDIMAKHPDTLKPTRWQKFMHRMVNTLQPLQDYNEHMERQGVKVSTAQNIYMAFSILRGRQITEQNADHANYVVPMLDALRVMAGKTKMKETEFMGLYSQWVRAKNAFIFNAKYELENIKLTPEQHEKRIPLKLADRRGTFKGNYLEALREIVNAPGAKLEDSVEPVTGLSNDEATKLIKAVNKAGFSDAMGEEFNKAFDPMRRRVTENQIQSGSFSEADLRQQRSQENPYYMPQSDWADEDIRVPQKVFGSPLGAFDRMAYLGRETPIDDPVQAMINKLLFSAKDIADNEATKVLLDAARNPKQRLEAEIYKFDMDEIAEDAIKGGKLLGEMKKIAAGPTSIIHNEGKDRYVIKLPETSQQLRAIKESQNPVPLHGIHKAVSKPTGLYGRFHTALSPPFALVNAVIRDGLYGPGMMVFQGKAHLIPKYVANYMKYGGPFGAWKAYLKGFRAATFKEMETYAKANPTSFAGRLYELEKAGGGFNFRDGFNNVKKLEKLRDMINAQSKDPINRAKHWTNYFFELQDAFATGSMMTGRVAAFDAAIDSGMTKKEAAFYVRRLLDYQQTSEGGRILNSWFAFARVGLTGVDALISALKDEKGHFVPKRAAVGMGLMSIAVASAYGAVVAAMGEDNAKKLSDNALSKNVIIPNPFDPNTPLQLPIELGMPRLAWGIAMMANRVAQGHTTMDSATRAVKNLLFENVSPLHPIEAEEGADSGTVAKDIAGAFVPSVARPLYESFINQTSFGSHIHESPEYTQGYASETARITTGNMYRGIAKFMRENTGLDAYPETYKHLLSAYGPGFMSLFFKGLEKEDIQAAGLEVDMSQATIFSAIFNHDLEYASGKGYHRSKTELQDARKQLHLLESEDKPIPAKIQAKVDLDKDFINASREHSKAVRKVTENKLMGTGARTSRLAAIQRDWIKTQQELTKKAERLQH